MAKGFPPPFTHDLLLLMETVVAHCAGVESLRDGLASLMPYAVEARYPDDLFVPTREDAWEAREAAQNVLEWLRSHLEGLFL